MTSIVITPFDSEHTEELKEFLWTAIDRADFEECMPPSIQLMDVIALQVQHECMLAALRMIRNASMSEHHSDATRLIDSMKQIATDAITIATRNNE